VSGTNVIGILKGQFFNTANDEVVILGAHLDTRGILHEGVNNDGSGLAALISLAEDLNGKYYMYRVNVPKYNDKNVIKRPASGRRPISAESSSNLLQEVTFSH